MNLKVILCLAALMGAVSLLHAQTDQDPSGPATSLGDLSESLESLSQKVTPGVVQIFASAYVPVAGTVSSSADLFGRRRSSGSGVILDPEGYVVTNAHVVEGATRVKVLLAVPAEDAPEGRSILKPRGKMVGGQVVGIDLETDLAVLKIQGGTDLPHLQLGNSDELSPGELVLAFGSPLGLENSVTLGVVSAVARQLRPEDPMIYIQTDASINPGNSGGPLVDTEGRLVGINTLIFSQSGGSEGLGFAAPSNIVRNVYEQIRETGRVRRGEIGVHAQTITPELAEGLGLPQSWGVVLGDVYPRGPAEKAGLRIGDIVLSLDGKTMENGRQLDVNLYQRAVGQKVKLKILRESRTLDIEVPVVERQDDPNRFAEMVRPDRNLIPKLGILAIEIDSEVRDMLPQLREPTGVLVAARSRDIPAFLLEEGFRPGDVIHSINGKEIRTPSDLRSELAKLDSGDPVAVQVERRGKLMYIAFNL
jgi:serine protease Do